jgi:hypothetical protein
VNLETLGFDAQWAIVSSFFEKEERSFKEEFLDKKYDPWNIWISNKIMKKGGWDTSFPKNVPK